MSLILLARMRVQFLKNSPHRHERNPGLQVLNALCVGQRPLAYDKGAGDLNEFSGSTRDKSILKHKTRPFRPFRNVVRQTLKSIQTARSVVRQTLESIYGAGVNGFSVRLERGAL